MSYCSALKLGISASVDGVLKVWDAATGREVFSASHPLPVITSGVTADCGIVMTVTGDGAIWRWRLGDARQAIVFGGLPARNSAQPKGSRIAATEMLSIDVREFEIEVSWSDGTREVASLAEWVKRKETRRKEVRSGKKGVDAEQRTVPAISGADKHSVVVDVPLLRAVTEAFNTTHNGKASVTLDPSGKLTPESETSLSFSRGGKIAAIQAYESIEFWSVQGAYLIGSIQLTSLRVGVVFDMYWAMNDQVLLLVHNGDFGNLGPTAVIVRAPSDLNLMLAESLRSIGRCLNASQRVMFGLSESDWCPS